jgi:hypothetical protein
MATLHRTSELGLTTIFLLSLIVTTIGFGQQRDLMIRTYSPDHLKQSLLSPQQWHLFPTARERNAWDHISEALRKEYVKRGEDALTFQWPTLSTDLYLEYARIGIRRNYDLLYHERRRKIQDLVLAECIEHSGRFLKKIAEGIRLVSEEPTWVVPAHLGALQTNAEVPDKSHAAVDLYSAETGNLLAWTYYLIGGEMGRISPNIPRLIESELKTRLLDPNLQRDDFWWMWTPGKDHHGHAINNWTPWICSNWLAVTLLMEKRSEIRLRTISKIVSILDRFLNNYPDDGGVDEGPNYWNHSVGSLYESLVLLGSATGATSPLFSHPLIREMGRYIYRTHVSDDCFVTISDSPVKIPFPSSLAILFGRDIHDENLAGLGAALAREQNIFSYGIRGSMTRQLFFLFNADVIEEQTPRQPLLTDVWLPQSQFMAAREKENSAAGFYLAGQGLHNGKSHNHNDVGNFLLYFDGKPFIIDVGPEGYNARTFSADRYKIWTMQSAFHNLPTINGVMEEVGRDHAARDVRYMSCADSVSFSLDIAGAYPPEANVEKWVRSMRMDRSRGVVSVTEDYILGAAAKDLTLTLMTSGRILRIEADRLVVRAKGGKEELPADVEIQFDPHALLPSVETIRIQDAELRAEWGTDLQRILLKAKNPQQRGKFTVSFHKLPN